MQRGAFYVEKPGKSFTLVYSSPLLSTPIDGRRFGIGCVCSIFKLIQFTLKKADLTLTLLFLCSYVDLSNVLRVAPRSECSCKGPDLVELVCLALARTRGAYIVRFFSWRRMLVICRKLGNCEGLVVD